MKFVKYYAILVLLMACSVNQNNMIDQYCDELLSARDENEESKALENLGDYLQRKQISFAIYKEINCALTDLAHITPADSTYPVTIKFQEAGSAKEIVKSGWQPKNDEHAFFLYRE